MSDSSTLTPGGPRPRRLIHAVGPAGTVRYAPDGEAHVVVAAREPVAEGHVVTPGGPRHPSLVHAVPPGHAVDLSGDAAQLVELSTDRRIAVAPPAPEADPAPALGSGWIAFAYWSNGTGTPLSSFRTSWRVPEAPQSQDGQTIFLFNGIQNGGANFGILQPVLQWGPSAAGGGAYWSVASWYVTEGGQAFHTTLVRVNSGDALVGVMTLAGSSGGSFDYVSQFAGIAGTLLTMQGIAELTWCNETLEAYAVAQCSDYPDVDATRFSEISIETGGKSPRLVWTAENAVTDCGQHAVVVSNANPGGEVDIYYAADSFAPVFHQGDPGSGIGGYDLRSPADRAFAFDYDGSGKLDHLVLYRPGTGAVFIEKNVGGQFSPVYQQGDPGSGIGGYDLRSAADRVFAFDYDGSGRLDHLVLYRPGTGTLWILKNVDGQFSPVFHQGDPGSGIGGYDLRSPADRVFAFDYDGSGRLDHLVLYRPGTGAVFVLKNVGGQFSPVFHQGDPGSGIGGYDLRSPADRVFAFDYDGSGKLDHLVLYRPGTGAVFVLKNVGGQFSPVFHQGDPGSGIGGYDLRSAADRAFAFDYDGSGKLDHLAFYRPGAGTFWILENAGGQFVAVYRRGDPGSGVGGYDLRSAADRAFAFDYDGSGKQDHLALYRPGTGTFWILEHT